LPDAGRSGSSTSPMAAACRDARRKATQFPAFNHSQMYGARTWADRRFARAAQTLERHDLRFRRSKRYRGNSNGSALSPSNWRAACKLSPGREELAGSNRGGASGFPRDCDFVP
jgi:hypothetical protein